MSDDGHATAREPRRLASVFDQFPPGTPLSLDDIEVAMSRDTERHCLAALDRALARLATPGPHRPPAEAPVTPPEQTA